MEKPDRKSKENAITRTEGCELKDKATRILNKLKAIEEKSDKVSLRIDQRTIILVPRHKCTEEYRQEYIKKLNSSRNLCF